MEEYYVAFKEKDPSMQKPNLKWNWCGNSMLPSIGKAMAPKAQGPHINITVPTVNLGAWERGAYNSRGNQFALLTKPIHHSTFHKKVEDKVNQFQWVANMIAIGQPQWAISREVPIEVSILSLASWIRHINVGSLLLINSNKGLLKQAMMLPFPSLVVQLDTAVFPTPTPPDLLKVAKRDQVHKRHFVKLAKAIPSMIQLAIKKAMQLTRDKLESLCSTVEVLKSEVSTLRKEVYALSGPPSTINPIPPEPATVPV
ncbi:hypothetical protein HAX54_050259, partial [Datura stramonium]|nr:hypothetical protein [Datura stramonium]